MKSVYGQFCPVAVASEIFAERWTPVILRELVLGSRRFNDIQRGVPRISRALLVKRLRELAAHGVISSAGGEYRLTVAGQELGEVVVHLGTWGARWTAPVRRDRLDAKLLMWDMRRRIALERLPEKRVVVRFDFRGVPAGHKAPKTYWLVMERPEVDLCILEPGFEVDVYVDADLAALSRVWLGEIPIRQAIREGGINLNGERQAVRDFPSWLLLSTLAAVPRPADAIQRRVA
ncbi:MAG TPA: helix-turn-helix domain-containing protein [Burkholderiales bacterium]|nr:helix-turn-helix domain-containing protein [Burkholderiales bacterium]